MVKNKEISFIPPKKRKNKESNNTTPHNNVDHITKIQVKALIIC